MTRERYNTEAQIIHQVSDAQRELWRVAKMMTTSDLARRQELMRSTEPIFGKLRQLAGLTNATPSEIRALQESLSVFEMRLQQVVDHETARETHGQSCSLCGGQTTIDVDDSDSGPYCPECVEQFTHPRLVIAYFFGLWDI